jgi:arsenate reductase
MAIRIYHNPRCSKSRATLALLEERGLEPEIVRYLDDPPSADELRQLLVLLGRTPRELARRGETAWSSLELADADDSTILEAMVSHPKLIERPIVVNGDRAALGRPPEAVLEIL